MPDKSKLKEDDNSSETSGDTDTDKTRKSSTNDDIPQEEKGKSFNIFFIPIKLTILNCHRCIFKRFFFKKFVKAPLPKK